MVASGTEFAGYRIEEPLGRGGMGVVYEATQLSIPRPVALKLLRHQEPEWEERFRREALAQATLDHPCIVPVYDAGSSEHGLYISMRLVRGRTLKDAIRSGELDPTSALALLSKIADALDFAHAAGIVHRDVKPQNILIAPNGHPYLADFGIVRRVDVDTALTQTGQLVGTPDYVAPEQVMGEPATAASDVYSLAVVLYECLTSTVPHAASTPAAALYARLSRPPPRPSAERPGLPEALDAVLARGLARDPRGRHGTATELIREAEQALSAPARRRGRVRAPHLPRRALFAPPLAVALAAAFVVTRNHDPPTPPPIVAQIEILTTTPGVPEKVPAAHDLAFSPATRNPPKGTLIRFRVTVSGFSGDLAVHCELHDVTTHEIVGTAAVVVSIHRQRQQLSQSVWIADSGAPRRVYPAITLWGPPSGPPSRKHSKPKIVQAPSSLAGSVLARDRSAPFTTGP